MISIAYADIVSQKLGLTPREVLRWARDLDLDVDQVKRFLRDYDRNRLRIMIQHHEPTMAQLPDDGKHTASLMARILGGK